MFLVGKNFISGLINILFVMWLFFFRLFVILNFIVVYLGFSGFQGVWVVILL